MAKGGTAPKAGESLREYRHRLLALGIDVKNVHFVPLPGGGASAGELRWRLCTAGHAAEGAWIEKGERI